MWKKEKKKESLHSCVVVLAYCNEVTVLTNRSWPRIIPESG